MLVLWGLKLGFTAAVSFVFSSVMIWDKLLSACFVCLEYIFSLFLYDLDFHAHFC